MATGEITSPLNRLSLDEYMMNIACLTSLRSTCKRASVGAVLTVGGRIIATGYNGSPSGAPHCIDDDCIKIEGHCVSTTHAEQNAIASAARLGVRTEGATLYCTHKPCLNCTKLIINAGIKRIVFLKDYSEKAAPIASRFLEDAGVTVEQITQDIEFTATLK